MTISAYSIRDRFRRIDPILLLCSVIPTAFSLLTLFGCRDAYAGGMKRVIVQFAAAALGMLLTVMIANLDYEYAVNKLFWGIFAFSVVLLVLVLTPLGTSEGTNQSYIVIPFLPINLQPSEVVKFSFILTFAKHLDLVKAKINHPLSLLGLGLHAGLIIVLVLLEKDLGVALVYIALTAIMLFGAGLSLGYFAGAIGAAVLAAPYLWSVLATHQQERIIYGFRPDLDPLGAGMHAMTSKAAIASGGLCGRGMSGAVAYQSMPTKGTYTDFIFAIFGEMFGFFACFLLILIYAVMIIRTLHIARRHRKDMGSFICIGVAGVLLAQVLENIGMCLAMLPVVGITLPFMSYGGSSMLTNYALLALVHSVHANRNKYYFEREPS
ncbi:MAG: FtsW/RodA/SpoVE family cell cycle protein [Clostridia bacterium]|nr:FtsW/RodA/SpoVE family cell cycle protein [Clostridia bacterium]